MWKTTLLWCACAMVVTLETQHYRKTHLALSNLSFFTNHHRQRRCLQNERRRAYCNRTNFRTQFNFVYFVLWAESTKFNSIRKPYTYACVSDTTVAVRKFLAYESWQTLEYEIFTRTKISAITVSTKLDSDFFIFAPGLSYDLSKFSDNFSRFWLWKTIAKCLGKT